MLIFLNVFFFKHILYYYYLWNFHVYLRLSQSRCFLVCFRREAKRRLLRHLYNYIFCCIYDEDERGSCYDRHVRYNYVRNNSYIRIF